MKGESHNYVLANGLVSKNSHSSGYAMLTYQTAYLKANYPAEYMSALCSGVSDKQERVSVFLSEARRMGLEVRPPDVNLSQSTFTPLENGILVGLEGLKGLGKIAQELTEERKAGQFRDIFEFVDRMTPRGLNKTNLMALAKAGALDSFGFSRLGICATADEILVRARKLNKKLGTGQGALFEDQGWGFEISDAEYRHEDKLRLEKAVTGIYMSGHPLDEYADWVEENSDIEIHDLADAEVDQKFWICGVVTGVAPRKTKAGKMMATVTVEDLTGSVEVTLFPKSWEESMLSEGRICHLLVKTSTGLNDQKDVILMSEEVVVGEAPTTDVMKFFLPRGFTQREDQIAELKRILLAHRGKIPTELWISRSTHLNLDQTQAVDGSEALIAEVGALFRQFNS
jgi:DNA polymerase-3 subunit alpha